MIAILAALASYIVLQTIGSPPVLRRIFNRLVRPGVITFHGLGLVFPFLYFRAHTVRFFLRGTDGRDRVFVSADSIRFWIDPIFLLVGRVRMVGVVVVNPFLEYYNRQESFEKNRLLPRRHAVEIKRGRVTGGRVFVQDETMKPLYRITVSDIHLNNFDMDLATPVDVLFRTKRGSADLESGRITIGQSGHIGFIRLWGTTWGEIANVGDLPLLRGKIALEARHSGGSEGRDVEGFVGSLARENDAHHPAADETRNRLGFHFPINWEDYRVTFDLGLQKLIENILKSAKGGVLSQGFIYGGRGVFEVMKKPER